MGLTRTLWLIVGAVVLVALGLAIGAVLVLNRMFGGMGR